MSCGDLPPIPEIEVPEVPNVNAPQVSNFGLPSWPTIPLYPNFHLNVFDIMILLWILFNSGSLGDFNGMSDQDKQDAINDILNNTSGADNFDAPRYSDFKEIPTIHIKSLVPFIKGPNYDNIYDSIYRNYGNDPSDGVFEMIFNTNDPDVLSNLKEEFDNYNYSGLKLTRV